MYIVTNLSVTPPAEQECDAIEKIIYKNGEYIPADRADGFKAMKVEHISPTEETYVITVYVFEGHSLSGTEPIGKYEWRDDEPEIDK